jgi:hypothetical protein
MLATMPWLCVITCLRKGACRYCCPASEHALPASLSADRGARRFLRDRSGRERPPGKVLGENIDADRREREEHACPKERRVVNVSPTALPLRASSNVFAASVNAHLTHVPDQKIKPHRSIQELSASIAEGPHRTKRIICVLSNYPEKKLWRVVARTGAAVCSADAHYVDSGPASHPMCMPISSLSAGEVMSRKVP